MKKIIIYIIYFLAAIVIYVLIRAAFLGDINKNTTLENTAIELKDGSINTLKEIKNDAATIAIDIKQDIEKNNK